MPVTQTASGGSAVGRRLANLGCGMESMCATLGHSSICTMSPKDTVCILLVLLVGKLLLLKHEVWDPECLNGSNGCGTADLTNSEKQVVYQERGLNLNHSAVSSSLKSSDSLKELVTPCSCFICCVNCFTEDWRSRFRISVPSRYCSWSRLLTILTSAVKLGNLLTKLL